MSSYTTHKTPHVTHFPTLSGGVGPEELQRFYDEFFLQSNPPSTKLTLISRTIGADRVVDEIHVSFKHTSEMPWILPGIPPTGKRVEVVVVSIVTVRGGKLYSEHVYWDQASVLVQTGLLDPRLVPDKARQRLGVESLPVVGRAAAKRLLRGSEDGAEGEADNELLPGWYDDDDDEEEEEDEDEQETKGNSDSAKADGDATRQSNDAKQEEQRGRSPSPKEEDNATGSTSGADVDADAQQESKGKEKATDNTATTS